MISEATTSTSAQNEAINLETKRVEFANAIAALQVPLEDRNADTIKRGVITETYRGRVDLEHWQLKTNKDEAEDGSETSFFSV